MKNWDEEAEFPNALNGGIESKGKTEAKTKTRIQVSPCVRSECCSAGGSMPAESCGAGAGGIGSGAATWVARYWVGDMPTHFRNTVLKWGMDPKPEA